MMKIIKRKSPGRGGHEMVGGVWVEKIAGEEAGGVCSTFCLHLRHLSASLTGNTAPSLLAHMPRTWVGTPPVASLLPHCLVIRDWTAQLWHRLAVLSRAEGQSYRHSLGCKGKRVLVSSSRKWMQRFFSRGLNGITSVQFSRLYSHHISPI